MKLHGCVVYALRSTFPFFFYLHLHALNGAESIRYFHDSLNRVINITYSVSGGSISYAYAMVTHVTNVLEWICCGFTFGRS